MQTLPSAEFSRAPAKHLEAVFRGETILLTRYGRPYVVLRPPTEADTLAPEATAQGSR